MANAKFFSSSQQFMIEGFIYVKKSENESFVKCPMFMEDVKDKNGSGGDIGFIYNGEIHYLCYTDFEQGKFVPKEEIEKAGFIEYQSDFDKIN